MLGGKYRDKVRMYSETPLRSDDPKEIGKDLKARAEAGFTMLKTDLGAEAILGIALWQLAPKALQAGAPQSDLVMSLPASLTVLAIWLIAAGSHNWEHRKQTWLFFCLF